MRTRYRINIPQIAHFVTSTVVEWLPLFTTDASCDIIVRSLLYCRERKRLSIFGWVILDNHFHAILAGPDLSRTIADLKKFTAREALALLERDRRQRVSKSTPLLSRETQSRQRTSGLAGGRPSAVHSDRPDHASKVGLYT
jgi:REP-associated tyrosine transposase